LGWNCHIRQQQKEELLHYTKLEYSHFDFSSPEHTAWIVILFSSLDMPITFLILVCNLLMLLSQNKVEAKEFRNFEALWLSRNFINLSLNSFWKRSELIQCP